VRIRRHADEALVPVSATTQFLLDWLHEAPFAAASCWLAYTFRFRFSESLKPPNITAVVVFPPVTVLRGR
jgi:hypothetical protein